MTLVDVVDRAGGPPLCRVAEAAVHADRTTRPAFGRRGLQLALGTLWILDGALQLQPAMLTPRFANEVLVPAAAGQPGWVAGPMLHAARLIGAHAVAADLVFALVQLAIGAGLLLPRTVRPALVASVAWAAGIWVVGEGLGGIAGGTASFLTGAPGAALLYGLLAVAAWPGVRLAPPSGWADRLVAPRWFPRAWALLWVALGASALLPANRSAARVADQLATVAGAAPGRLDRVDQVAGELVRHAGGAAVALLVLVPVAVGLGGLGQGRVRRLAAGTGIVLAVVTWVVGQSVGQLFSGIATDPNTAPLLVLACLALLGTVDTATAARRRPLGAGRRRSRSLSPAWPDLPHP